MRALLVQDFLKRSASQFPNKLALICEGQRLTYSDVREMASCVAACLVANGVQRGDSVAVYLKNSVECVAGIFGILMAGAKFVVINHSTKPDKLLYILNNCQATAAIVDQTSKTAESLLLDRTATPGLSTLIHCGGQPVNSAWMEPSCFHFSEVQRDFSAVPPTPETIDLDLACLIYTSGTTGDPKGVMSDHSNVVFATESIMEYLRISEQDVIINMLPLSFDYGLYQLLMTFAAGATLVLESSFAFPAAILKRIEAEKVTGLPGVPTVFSMLLQLDLSQFDLSSLRYLTNTAAALPENHIRRIRDAFPRATLYSMYGLTETKRTLYLPPEELDRHPGSVGIPIPGTEAWLEDEHGNRLAPGQTGELVVRGRHVMRGYWNAPEATALRFRAGQVCVSGDLFRTDADGYFYFVGRKDDIIKSRGEKVAPKEVENVIYELEGVAEVAVVGVPDPLLGEAVKAFVVPSTTNLTKTAVLAHCKQHLEDFMIPKHVEFVGSLPLTPSGKITKKELK